MYYLFLKFGSLYAMGKESEPEPEPYPEPHYAAPKFGFKA
jgi:hypothetical protein